VRFGWNPSGDKNSSVQNTTDTTTEVNVMALLAALEEREAEIELSPVDDIHKRPGKLVGQPTVKVLRTSKSVKEILTSCIIQPFTPKATKIVFDKQLTNVKDKVQARVFNSLCHNTLNHTSDVIAVNLVVAVPAIKNFS
jgi:hypothetical protein